MNFTSGYGYQKTSHLNSNGNPFNKYTTGGGINPAWADWEFDNDDNAVNSKLDSLYKQSDKLCKQSDELCRYIDRIIYKFDHAQEIKGPDGTIFIIFPGEKLNILTVI